MPAAYPEDLRHTAQRLRAALRQLSAAPTAAAYRDALHELGTLNAWRLRTGSQGALAPAPSVQRQASELHADSLHTLRELLPWRYALVFAASCAQYRRLLKKQAAPGQDFAFADDTDHFALLEYFSLLETPGTTLAAARDAALAPARKATRRVAAPARALAQARLARLETLLDTHTARLEATARAAASAWEQLDPEQARLAGDPLVWTLVTSSMDPYARVSWWYQAAEQLPSGPMQRVTQGREPCTRSLRVLPTSVAVEVAQAGRGSRYLRAEVLGEYQAGEDVSAVQKLFHALIDELGAAPALRAAIAALAPQRV